jgi:hypothetical protein
VRRPSGSSRALLPVSEAASGERSTAGRTGHRKTHHLRLQSSRTRAPEREFARRFGPRQLPVAPSARSDDRQGANVATVASACREANLRAGMVVAAGTGRVGHRRRAECASAR